MLYVYIYIHTRILTHIKGKKCGKPDAMKKNNDYLGMAYTTDKNGDLVDALWHEIYHNH